MRRLSLLALWILMALPVFGKTYEEPSLHFSIDIPDEYEIAKSTKDNIYTFVAQSPDQNSAVIVKAVWISGSLFKNSEIRCNYSFFETVDTLFYNLPTRIGEHKHFWTGYIDREYRDNGDELYRTRSIYCEDICYVILHFSQDGQTDTAPIVDSFYSTHSGGPLNFLQRNIYSLLGEGMWSSILISFIYLCLNIGIILAFCHLYYSKSTWTRKILHMIIILLAISYVMAHNAFMDFIKGYISFMEFICYAVLNAIEFVSNLFGGD